MKGQGIPYRGKIRKHHFANFPAFQIDAFGSKIDKIQKVATSQQIASIWNAEKLSK